MHYMVVMRMDEIESIVLSHDETIKRHEEDISYMKEMINTHEDRIKKMEDVIVNVNKLIVQSQKLEAKLTESLVGLQKNYATTLAEVAKSQNKMMWKIVGVIVTAIGILGFVVHAL